MKFFKLGFLSLALCLFLSGCFGRIQPIYMVHNHPIPPSADFMTLDEISTVIERSAIDRQWVVKKEYPGLLRLTYSRKTHQAVIEVSFYKSHYSIKYVSSQDLLYNGSMIHRNYNRWVANLELDIEMNLQKAATAQ
jgi:hypothetical protein